MNLRRFLELTQFEHTLFGLPFAACALAFAAHRSPIALWRIAAALLAFTMARTAAMAWNRYVDRDVDAENPRTRDRPIPRGAVAPRAALATSLVAAGAFVALAAALGPLPLALSPVALVILLGYSHTKRFTWGSHLVLGTAIAGAPLGACIAARGTVDPEAALLSLAVGTWVAGFDLIYACQDVAFDRARGLHSFPARFGVAAALLVSAILHLVTVGALALAGVAAGAGPIYATAVALAALLLVIEHALVRPRDLSRVNRAFFTVNGWLSVLFLGGVLLDLAMAGGVR